MKNPLKGQKMMTIPRQTNASIPQQMNFIGKLEEDDGVAMLFFIDEKQQKKKNLDFSLNSLIVALLFIN